MKTSTLCVITSLLASGSVFLFDINADETPPQENNRVAKPSYSNKEQAFRDTLTNTTLSGKWRLVKDNELLEENEETYTIQSVKKVAGDFWLITARIRYADKDVTIPVPVRVKWAGDTPIISVTEAGLSGLGTYTARVMVYRNLYTGSWFGKDYGGFLNGTYPSPL